VDELQREIMLDAIAVALGVGLVGGFSYAAASSANLLAFDANIALFPVSWPWST
jgi:tRNA A37 threonylcarbamoyltransferase TsaD